MTSQALISANIGQTLPPPPFYHKAFILVIVELLRNVFDTLRLMYWRKNCWACLTKIWT